MDGRDTVFVVSVEVIPNEVNFRQDNILYQVRYQECDVRICQAALSALPCRPCLGRYSGYSALPTLPLFEWHTHIRMRAENQMINACSNRPNSRTFVEETQYIREQIVYFTGMIFA